ncbi:MAG TPA: nicotinate phosphoribosyltransferase [Bryobacteraceae bacterium]|nr:nicotinate phosphoribosyltransferase [Bryobacteraceae bacterium]
MNALLTDLYQLTMAAGYFEAAKTEEVATFELFVRRLPHNRNFLIAAGLQQAVQYLLDFRFTSDEIEYLKGLRQFERAHAGFFDYLAELRFTGDLFALPEGTPVFAGEPLLTVRAPIVEAQIPETYLLSTIAFQTLIATKAARIVEITGGRGVVEFGTRRAHSPEAGVLAGRAAYIGGCAGTSNTLTGMRYGIPVFGTAAHSWVQAFAEEREAFQRLQQLLGENTAYLIDTYDTLEGARIAASLGRPMWGVRIDSGNLIEVSRAVRSILDQAGLPDAKIMATSDLNEYKISELMAADAPIDVFGVGTDLATSRDVPSLSAVYKLVELGAGESHRFTAKYSEGKGTLPGAKQVFRFADHDLVGCAWECPSCCPGAPSVEALLRPVILEGQLVQRLPTATEAKAYSLNAICKMPGALRSLFDAKEPWPVTYSQELLSLTERVKSHRKAEA